MPAMLELVVLLIIIVALILIINNTYHGYSTKPVETFENFYLSACPSGYKSSYNSDGDILCCDGEIIANKCMSDRRCILNGKGTTDLPNCVTAIKKEYAEKSKTYCPSSMSSYFEDRGTNTRGCTSGQLNNTMTAPRDLKQPKCKIYSQLDENRNSKDSCYNQKMLDNVPCFGNNCKKEIVQPIKNGPILIQIGFTDSMGMHRIAYTKKSMENFLDVSNPNWRNQGIDLSKNINVAEVAKAFYVDRTLDQSHVQF